MVDYAEWKKCVDAMGCPDRQSSLKSVMILSMIKNIFLDIKY